jgi:hypothetical protein
VRDKEQRAMTSRAAQRIPRRQPVGADALARRAVRQPRVVTELFAGLSDRTADARYGSLRALRVISEQAPGALYPEIERCFDLLESERTFLRWGAIGIIGNLARVDRKRRIDGALGRYLKPITGPALIEAANTIRGAAMIAAAKPHLADRVARAFLSVEHARYRTAECRNVALGQVIASLDLFFDHVRRKRAISALVRRQLANPRPVVRRRAAAFLKRHRLAPE